MSFNVEDVVNRINNQIVDHRSSVIDDGTEKPKKKLKSSEGFAVENETDRIFSNFKLHDRVVAFYDGREWNVISLDFMLRHPILIYRHWSDKDQIYYDNSLLVCPLTLRSMIYKGRISIVDIKYNYELVIKNEDTQDIFPISNPYTGHKDEGGKEKKIKSQVKRHEVKILEHRDIFAFDSDPQYLTIETEEVEPIIDLKYYENRLGVRGEDSNTIFHPKTLVYVVQYYSETDGGYRHLVLISPNISKEEITGYKYRKSRFWSYSEQNKDKLIEKRAFTYPMLWHTIEKVKLYNYDTKVIIGDIK